jgi:hypothetical protein
VFGNPAVIDFDPSLAAAGSSSFASTGAYPTNATWTIGTNASIAVGTTGAPGSQAFRGGSALGMRIRAVNAAGTGVASAASNVQWAGDEPVWAWGTCYSGVWANVQPRGEDRCLVSKSGAVKANWYRASGATGYIVKRYAASSGGTATGSQSASGATTLTASVSGSSGLEAWYEVVSTNAAGLEGAPNARNGMAVSGSVTYNYTGTTQGVTIPVGITEVRLKLKGAAGGNGGAITQAPGYSYGGTGGSAFTASFFRRVNSAMTFNACVGGAGQSTSWTGSNFNPVTTSGGYNGGGNGQNGGGAGGGSTDLRDSGNCNATSSARRAIAAGGGGGGGGGASWTGSYGETYRFFAGAGGYNAGNGGNAGATGDCYIYYPNGTFYQAGQLATGGGYASASAGGAAGTSGGYFPNCGADTAGAGAAGAAYSGGLGSVYRGGGGGGGLFGGGGGGGTSSLVAVGVGAGGGRGTNGKSGTESAVTWVNGLSSTTLNGFQLNDTEVGPAAGNSGSLCLSWGESTACSDGGAANPSGAFDSSGSTPTIAGWAYDPDMTGTVSVLVKYCNGTYTAPTAPFFQHTCSTGWVTDSAATGTVSDLLRADVDNANPGLGIYHGYSVTPSVKGARWWCVDVVNVGPGSNATLTCKNLTIT